MNNDPKNVVVDKNKLIKSQTSKQPSTPIIPVSVTSNLIGHENFSRNSDTKKFNKKGNNE